MITREIKIEDFNYELPDERIAKFPLSQRDHSKLLLFKDGKLGEDAFYNLPNYLPSGSIMVFNNTRVIQARLHFRKTTGALIEVFLLEPYIPADYERIFLQKKSCSWLCMIGNLKKWKGNSIAKRWDLHWIPTLFVVDPQGRIAAAATTAEGLRAELYRLTGRKSLPAASRQRGEDIMTVLRQRHSERTFEERPVSEQDLADLLWAACGVNRPNGNLTAPTAMNRQEIRLYAFTAEGTYLYEPRLHTLKTVANGDNRQLVVSRQENFNGTPLFLVIVADMDKFGRNGSHAQLMTAVDVGNVSQNINIFCSAAGLKNCPRATMDTKALQSLLGLGENQIPLMNNAVGY